MSKVEYEPCGVCAGMGAVPKRTHVDGGTTIIDEWMDCAPCAGKGNKPVEDVLEPPFEEESSFESSEVSEEDNE